MGLYFVAYELRGPVAIALDAMTASAVERAAMEERAARAQVDAVTTGEARDLVVSVPSSESRPVRHWGPLPT